MSNIDKRALRETAEKATALNLDTAQEARQEDDECIECPTCGGDGYMEVQRDYCNIDGVALGVLFYGIGEHHGLAEEFFRAANPATVLALLDELEAEEKRNAELSRHLQCAHAFVEHTEAFGHAASNGILCCGDAQWNIDASKSALAAAGKGE